MTQHYRVKLHLLPKNSNLSLFDKPIIPTLSIGLGHVQVLADYIKYLYSAHQK